MRGGVGVLSEALTYQRLLQLAIDSITEMPRLLPWQQAKDRAPFSACDSCLEALLHGDAVKAPRPVLLTADVMPPTCYYCALQARCGNPLDVWMQLLEGLLRDASCRQALLKHSSGAAAAPARLVLAQLAASLAKELAASAAS